MTTSLDRPTATPKRSSLPCTCRGYDPADPARHGDTSEGCPRHDPKAERVAVRVWKGYAHHVVTVAYIGSEDHTWAGCDTCPDWSIDADVDPEDDLMARLLDEALVCHRIGASSQ